MALLSNAIILVTNLYSLQLFVAILVCLQHLQSGTQGLTDVPVLPQLPLTWLLIRLALAQQTSPLFWKADKMPSVSARLSEQILQCEETPLQMEEWGGFAPHPYPIRNYIYASVYVRICVCRYVCMWHTHIYSICIYMRKGSAFEFSHYSIMWMFSTKRQVSPFPGLSVTCAVYITWHQLLARRQESCTPPAKDSKVILQSKAGGSLTVKIRLDSETMERKNGGKAFMEMEGQVNFYYGLHACKSGVSRGGCQGQGRGRGRRLTPQRTWKWYWLLW